MGASGLRPYRCFDQDDFCDLCKASKNIEQILKVVCTCQWHMCLIAYLSDEIFSLGRDFNAVLRFLRPADWCVLNQVVHLVLVRIVKRRDTNYHLVDQDTQGPPV